MQLHFVYIKAKHLICLNQLLFIHVHICNKVSKMIISMLDIFTSVILPLAKRTI